MLDHTVIVHLFRHSTVDFRLRVMCHVFPTCRAPVWSFFFEVEVLCIRSTKGTDVRSLISDRLIIDRLKFKERTFADFQRATSCLNLSTINDQVFNRLQGVTYNLKVTKVLSRKSPRHNGTTLPTSYVRSPIVRMSKVQSPNPC